MALKPIRNGLPALIYVSRREKLVTLLSRIRVGRKEAKPSSTRCIFKWICSGEALTRETQLLIRRLEMKLVERCFLDC